MILDFSAMTPNLQFSKAGRFFLLKAPLTKVDIEKLFLEVVTVQDAKRPAAAPSASGAGSVPATEYRTLKDELKEHLVDGVRVNISSSAIVRSFYSSPNFAQKSGLVEKRFGYLLMIEIAVKASKLPEQVYLFVQQDQAIDPTKYGLLSFCDPIEMPAFMAPFLPAVAPLSKQRQPRIERMAMKFIASSQAEIRQKTVEAHNVEATTSSLGLHRTIPGSMTVSRPIGAKNRLISLSPHRQSVREGATRVSYKELLEWVETLVVAFYATKNTTAVTSAFLAQMAQPLLELVDKVPSSLLIERREFLDKLSVFMSETGRKWVPTKNSPANWTLEQIMDELAEPIRLDPQPYDRSGAAAKMSPIPTEVFFKPLTPLACFAGSDPLRIRVTSRTCTVQLPNGAGRLINSSDPKKKPMSLGDVLNDERAFRVVFDAGRALYCSEGAFRSSNLKLAITQLLHTFVPVPSLGAVITEKGSVVPSSTVFAPTSSFAVIENEPIIAAPSSILICDDDTSEWCDYIEIDSTPPRIRWLHAKVQRVEDPNSIGVRAAQKKAGLPISPPIHISVSNHSSLSASDLQEVIGQGMKNLARLRISATDPAFSIRSAKWLTGYCSLPKPAKISRLRRPSLVSSAQLEQRFYSTASDPIAAYEVGLVVPNYKLNDFKAALLNIELGTASQSTVQAFWLLSGFVHACLEVGAKPLIFMQP